MNIKAIINPLKTIMKKTLAIDLEPITGEREFKTIGKFVTSNPNDKGSQLFAGMIVGCINPPKGGDWEVWECEITIKPRRKSKVKSKFQSYRYDQLISMGLLNTSSDSTEEPYYENK